MFSFILEWYKAHISYATIMLCMTIESTFLPLPSEAVVPPAVWFALDKGSMNIILIVIFGTLGALIGSLINYTLAYFLGPKIVYAFANTRFARMCLVTPEKIEKAEQYFVKHGRSSTFIGRLVPGIRHLISIPAGLAKMPLRDFITFTVLGAGIWNIILAILGYVLYTQQDMLGKYAKELSLALLVVGGIFVVYLIVQGMKKNNKNGK
ncbi:MAG: DedA family protein [Bacteroidota bacterium]|nr:DedA family protein [Bacteroidota bacterium]